jgi:branched-subunit amino acid ABC-type transport system permease component
VASVVLIVALFVFFELQPAGQGGLARATAVNRDGARLMGILRRCGLAEFRRWPPPSIGTLSGLLIGPSTTVFYDSGFLIGLKGFVAAVFAGLASYPLAPASGVRSAWGSTEAFGSFWASAFKEVIVFTAILPALPWRSFIDPHGEEQLRWPASSAPASSGGLNRRTLRVRRLHARGGGAAAVAVGARLLDRAAAGLRRGSLRSWRSAWCSSRARRGLTSFGQAAFAGIGAYATAYLGAKGGAVRPGRAWLAGLGPTLATVVALVLGWITLRMSGHYLPLATIAWSLALFYTLMGNLDALGQVRRAAGRAAHHRGRLRLP